MAIRVKTENPAEIRVKPSRFSQKLCIFAPRKRKTNKIMTTRREKAKPQKPQQNKQLEATRRSKNLR